MTKSHGQAVTAADKWHAIRPTITPEMLEAGEEAVADLIHGRPYDPSSTELAEAAYIAMRFVELASRPPGKE